MAKARVLMEVGRDGIAVITISNPPVNALARPIIAGLKEKYAEAMNRNDVKAVVLTACVTLVFSTKCFDFTTRQAEVFAKSIHQPDGDYGKFSGGFDINVFAEVHKTGDISVLPDVSVDLVVNTIEDAKKPSVAAIQGLALGGGLELTMGCHARISTPDAQLGLPELTLGVIPGFGGTQRLPRLVGISKAIDIMLLSKSIRAKEGKEYGLIDAIASAEELLMEWALDLAEKRIPRLSSLQRTDKLGPLSETRQIVQETREKFKKTSPHMPQHQVCLDAIEEGLVFGGYAGVLKEASLFKKIVLSTTARSLVHVFFSQRLTFKVPKVTDIGAKPRHIKFVAIIGGGLMGSGIATALLLSDINVILKEINSTFLQRGLKTIDENLDGLVKKGTLTLDKKSKALSNLRGALDYSDFRNVDMVIEAVVEDVQLKQSIFCEIEKICPPHCILASNTSTIDLNVIGEKTNSHDRIVGAHFFRPLSYFIHAANAGHGVLVFETDSQVLLKCIQRSCSWPWVLMKAIGSPAHIMPLLEVVRTEKTSPQVVLDIMNLGKIIQKVPVVVGNCPGFAVNRTFFPYSQAAQLLVHLGVNLFRVDRVVCNFGMPLGPFQLQDVAGYGVALAVKQIYSAAYKGRTFESNLLELMVENGRNGKNNRKGYYLYKPGSKLEPDPTVQKIIDESRRRANLIPDGKPINVTDQEIVEMIFFPVVNEACRVLAEGVVVRASDIDIASVLGMGFPKYRGGLLFWADTIGSSYIYSKLKGWEESYGGFFAPSQYLEERAKKGSPLSLVDLSKSQNTRSRL